MDEIGKKFHIRKFALKPFLWAMKYQFWNRAVKKENMNQEKKSHRAFVQKNCSFRILFLFFKFKASVFLSRQKIESTSVFFPCISKYIFLPVPAYFNLVSEILIHAQAQSKAQAWKVVHYFWWWCPSVHTYGRTYKTKQTDQRLNHFSS